MADTRKKRRVWKRKGGTQKKPSPDMLRRLRRFILRERTPVTEAAPPPPIPQQPQTHRPPALTPVVLPPAISVASLPVIDAFKYAGTVFTDGKHVLCGYQPHKKVPFISGIGGGREAGETYMQTALRETVEELLEVKPVSPQLLERLATVQPQQVLRNGAYVMVLYSFSQLAEMLLICRDEGLRSPIYATFPSTLIDIVHLRRVSPKAELSHMALLPIVTHPVEKGPLVENNLVADLALIAATLSSK